MVLSVIDANSLVNVVLIGRSTVENIIYTT